MLVPISNRDRRLPIRLRSLVGGQRDPRLRLRASRLVQDAVRAWPGPCGVIKAALDDAVKTKHGPIILTSIDQQPWTSDGFRASWRKACRKAGIVGITFNDLRGTAVTRLARAGCTKPKSPRSPDTACATCVQSLTRIICIAIRPSPKVPSASSKGEQKLPTELPTGPRFSSLFYSKPGKSVVGSMVGAQGLEPWTR